jgi:ADP-ribosylglycohydrolase
VCTAIATEATSQVSRAKRAPPASPDQPNSPVLTEYVCECSTGAGIKERAREGKRTTRTRRKKKKKEEKKKKKKKKTQRFKANAREGLTFVSNSETQIKTLDKTLKVYQGSPDFSF